MWASSIHYARHALNVLITACIVNKKKHVLPLGSLYLIFLLNAMYGGCMECVLDLILTLLLYDILYVSIQANFIHLM